MICGEKKEMQPQVLGLYSLKKRFEVPCGEREKDLICV